MNDTEFRDWITDLRKDVVYSWDVLGQPPRVGWSQDEMVSQFKMMESYPVHEFLKTDELTGEKNLIINNANAGIAVNQFFPNMMKTRITYGKNGEGRSIYDHFKDDALYERVVTYARRHFKRDSFYNHSITLSALTMKEKNLFSDYRIHKTGVDFIEDLRAFQTKGRLREYDFWLSQKDAGSEYTGYNLALRGQEYLELSRAELEAQKAKKNIDWRHLTNIVFPEGPPEDDKFVYQLRLYEKGQKIFPIGYKAFRVSWAQAPVNFPPLTAKYLYERYTSHIPEGEKVTVYDPSSGWAGRILGAMSVSRPLHYVGTDPNTDNLIPELGISKYDHIADFYNTYVKGSDLDVLFGEEVNTYEVFCLGSEVIGNDPGFQKYKGKLDMVFTSPPYFAKEVYSEDEEQSCNKFPTYEGWVDGFLRPTLETANEYLKPDRYLLMNIADAKFGSKMLPLEADTIKIAESLGLKHVETLRMGLASMPGANRTEISEDGEASGKSKNFAKYKGRIIKFEPILCFLKP